MTSHGFRSLCRWTCATFALGAALLGTAGPAHAVPAVTVEPGLGRYYRAQHWVPVRVNLLNQGAAARVDVRIRVSNGSSAPSEYVLKARDLPAGANEHHTFYVRASQYGTGDANLELIQNGKVVNKTPLRLMGIDEANWLAVGIGEQTTGLQSLLDVKMPRHPLTIAQPWMRDSAPDLQPCVTTLSPNAVPDRGQGLAAADMVVLGEVTERELSPEQATALRDYAQSGGTLVICGGVNWNRLATPFFRDLLPLEVQNGRTLASLGSLQSFTESRTSPPSGSYPVCVGSLRPDAEVWASMGDVPLVTARPVGAGKVILVTFNPFSPPFRGWDGAGNFWKKIIRQPMGATLLGELNARDFQYWGTGRFADAPYAIPQLDIPSFYVIALFLLAYIVVLVPVNYTLLKRLDRRELAWLTTPAIVVLFSVGAYLIGYGIKGGRTLAINAGIVEVAAGQDRAPGLFYTGLFSPRKAAYELHPAEATPDQPALESALLSNPNVELDTRSRNWRSVQSDSPYVENFAVDMWSMRVVRMDGMVSLGGGITAELQPQRNQLSGTVRNGSRFALQDCRIISNGNVFELPNLPSGQAAEVKGTSSTRFDPNNLRNLLPRQPTPKRAGEERRLREAILTALPAPTNTGVLNALGGRTLLLGWIREPIARLNVGGNTPQQTSATLVVVHLDPKLFAASQSVRSLSSQTD